MKTKKILADGRWSGTNGIGRFSREILARLQNTDIIHTGPKPLSLKNLSWLPWQLYQKRKNYDVFFSPGFNPVVYSSLPFVVTICDLIHLHFPDRGKLIKKIYYETLIKSGLAQAKNILTISEFSKNDILNWTKISSEKVKVVSCGVSEDFSPMGNRYSPGFPYFLHVGNTKAHKNVLRLVQAFALAKIDPNIHLILTGHPSKNLLSLIHQLKLTQRIIFSKVLSESQLAEYYRGALAVLFPSLYEGFGLPVVEAMACGTPVLTSTATSLPEVAGDAALLVDPYRTDAIADGIEKMVENSELRNDFIAKGLQQAQLFNWDKTAREVQKVLDL